jgi:hypothetical protein
MHPSRIRLNFLTHLVIALLFLRVAIYALQQSHTSLQQ